MRATEFEDFGQQGSIKKTGHFKPACWQCSEDHAAVEHSFVQFYPTLKPVAKKFGTYKQAAENVDAKGN